MTRDSTFDDLIDSWASIKSEYFWTAMQPINYLFIECNYIFMSLKIYLNTFLHMAYSGRLVSANWRDSSHWTDCWTDVWGLRWGKGASFPRADCTANTNLPPGSSSTVAESLRNRRKARTRPVSPKFRRHCESPGWTRSLRWPEWPQSARFEGTYAHESLIRQSWWSWIFSFWETAAPELLQFLQQTFYLKRSFPNFPPLLLRTSRR